MDQNFDFNEAKKNLEKQERQKKEALEQERIDLLENVVNALKTIKFEPSVEVFLVGSITQPYKFHSGSDVDIVLKNFTGDRFDLWPQLERMIKRNVEVIIFENCSFQDYVMSMGYRVI